MSVRLALFESFFFFFCNHKTLIEISISFLNVALRLRQNLIYVTKRGIMILDEKKYSGKIFSFLLCFIKDFWF